MHLPLWTQAPVDCTPRMAAHVRGNNDGMIPEAALLDRLSDKDLALLAAAAGEHGLPPAVLRREPRRIDELLARHEAFAALFGGRTADPLVVVSPFLTFAVLLAHTPSLLSGLAFVPEPVGGRRRVPVFEVEPLRDFVADPLRRLFIADLLASYTHVASGPIWVRTRRGWRHRRFSELDPMQFGELILMTPPGQRLVLYRRLGDLALFLTGVFPDHVEGRSFPPVGVERLSRAVAEGEIAVSRRRETMALDLRTMDLLERLGGRSYRVAWGSHALPGRGLRPRPRRGRRPLPPCPHDPSTC